MNKDDYYPKERISALIDGIFAFAMTLLVLSIEVPTVPLDQLGGALLDDLNKFTYYVLSFFLLATFWITSIRKMKDIGKVNHNFLWLNIWNLMFIVFIPFSTQLIGKYDDNMVAVDIFHLNLLLAGIFSYLIFSYARGHNLFKYRHEEKEASRLTQRSLVVPVLALIGIIIAFFTPGWSTLIYIVTPVALRIIDVYNAPSPATSNS